MFRFNRSKAGNTANKLNLDDLFEKTREYDMAKLQTFQQILGNAHALITKTANTTRETSCFFTVPEIVLGMPKYNQAECIAYLLSKLAENDLAVRFIEPSAIFITWYGHVPTYVRDQYKKSTGVEIDNRGHRIPVEEELPPAQPPSAAVPSQSAKDKKYNPIGSYRPGGNLVYNGQLLSRIDARFNGTNAASPT